MPEKLVGQNYTTPDLVAKVTGRAKYAEDYRADGMLFAKLLLSPMPHCRVRSVDARAALALPGVKAILRADDFAAASDGALPTGRVPDEWSYGDLDAGFKSAAVIVDETFVVQSTGHQPMETRSAMAYWQNGKLYLHGSTQSVIRTVDPLANWLGMDASNIVLVSEYCGGGFGSKGGGAVSMVIPALLSKKTGAPVMMRISREEELYIGRARNGLVGRARAGIRKGGGNH